MAKYELIQDAPASLTRQDWTETVSTASRLRQQDRMLWFLMAVYGFFAVTGMAIFFLQGFHAWGFTLPEKVLMWVGGVTVGDVSGIVSLSLPIVFRTARNK